MSALSRTSGAMNSEATPSATSSPELASGQPLSAETDGTTTDLSGQVAAPANPSRRRAKGSASKTQDISGPTGCA